MITDEEKSKLQADAGIPHLPTDLTYECRMATSGEGPRAYDWSDKPHRLVFDLCREIERLAASPAGVVKPLEHAACVIKDAFEDAGVEVGGTFARNLATEVARIMSALEPAGVGVDTQEPGDGYYTDDPRKLKKLLEQRDKWIVESGNWSAFVAALTKEATMTEMTSVAWIIAKRDGGTFYEDATMIEEFSDANSVPLVTLLSAQSAIAERDKRIAELEKALSKINDIRNSIIGCQKINWSEHIYPLVAALNEAGIEGQGYPEAREYVGTLIERTNAAEARAEAAEELLKEAGPIINEFATITAREDRAATARSLLDKIGGNGE